MSRIRSKDTKPELVVRKKLHAAGFRYRLHDKKLPGVPDIILPKYHAVVFVHGCFWHRHPKCNRSTVPSANKDYWLAKFKKNVNRDRKNIKLLQKEGWHVIVIWECECRDNTILKDIMEKIVNGEDRVQIG